MIAGNIRRIMEELPEGVRLVAVSKFHDSGAVMQAYGAGQRSFGESRVQELLAKQPLLPDDIDWHFIGHLQTNKVRQIIGKVAMVESIDSERLLSLVDAESEKAGVVTDVLMQVHVALEETKFGFSPEELVEFFRERRFENLRAVHIRGIMGMATNTDSEARVRDDFRRIRSLYDTIIRDVAPDLRRFDTISMGMSHDWKIAVEEGSTSVRIGTSIFGPREY